MADDNNQMAGYLPKKPNPALKKLDTLVGTWRISGGYKGTDVYEWMEGGFFFIHHFDGITHQGRHVKGIEYIGFDEDTQTLRSHLMGVDGMNFTYTWDVQGDDWTIWFGDKGSDNFWKAALGKDGATAEGRWQWPEGKGSVGGYVARMTRVKTSKRRPRG